MATMEEEARRVIDAARGRDVHLRLIGGLAVKLHCPSAEHRELSRTYGDLDCVGYRSQREKISRLLQDLGYEPNRRFNALQGHRRLLFENPQLGFDVDVFLEVFPMCHELNFLHRLELDEYTVPVADLLLSKLQVVELNEKDIKDTYALIEDHEIGETDDREVINSQRIARLCGDDWGWYKTVTMNIEKVVALADDYLEGEEKELVTGRLRRLHQIIEEAPKSMKWRMRARVGEKVRWYNLPEDIADVHGGG